MLKSHRIDINNIDGSLCTGLEIEVQGSMDVLPMTEQLEGVHQSSLFMSLDTAHDLLRNLTAHLDRAKATGWKPQRP